jgi:NADH-quinone oxidoreductase subunit G
MPEQPVSLTIDDKEVTVPKGTLIIRAAEQLGIEVPRFCDHPYLAPAGACRQCYVQVEGQGKLQTSCTVSVAPGMVVRTQNTSDVVRQAQVANLEFLLLNHPLDCPICDRGGECPLQDQALAFGPARAGSWTRSGSSRSRCRSRRWSASTRAVHPVRPVHAVLRRDQRRPVPRALRAERGRAGLDRGGEDFRSPFSGNTIQICPVGALTATPYRFVARPFDLTSGDSVCQHCSAGCNVRVDVRRGEVVRVLARENPDVNDAWICDKGRFAYRHADAPERITTPLIRDRGLEPASFGEVLPWLAERCRSGRVAFLTGGRLMDEDYYALSKLARTVIGTNDLDHRRAFHGGLAEVVAAAAVTDRDRSVTYRDIEQAPVILLAGLDAEQEVPILHLRIRKAAARGAKVFVVHPRRTRLHDVAEHLPTRPGHEVFVLDRIREGVEDDSFEARAAAALRSAGDRGVVLAGERLAEHPLAADLALAVASKTGSRFGYVTRRANDRGALGAGVHPALLPGGRRLASPTSERRSRRSGGRSWPPRTAGTRRRSCRRARTGA